MSSASFRPQLPRLAHPRGLGRWLIERTGACYLLLWLAAGLLGTPASAQITFSSARHCGGVGLDWSSDLGVDYGDSLGPCNFISGSSVDAATSRGFGLPSISAASRGISAAAGPTDGSAPVASFLFNGFVTTNGQQFGCTDGWIYGLFSSGNDEIILSFSQAATVHWALRVRWVGAVRNGCLGGASWSVSTPAGQFSSGAVGSGQQVFTGTATNTGSLLFGIGAAANVTAGNGDQGDTASLQFAADVYISGTPFVIPQSPPEAVPTDLSGDRNGNGVTDASELFAVVNQQGLGEGFARASVGGNTGAAANLVSHGYCVVDDFSISIPATDTGKPINELVFRTAETGASNPLGAFNWNGIVDVKLLRDDGAGNPVLEAGGSPYAEFALTTAGGTTVTRTPLGVSYNFGPTLGGSPIGAADLYEYTIRNPAGLFTIPRLSQTTTRWWIGMRSATSTASGVSLVKRATLADGSLPARRYRPNPSTGAPDLTFSTLPLEVCALDGDNFECPFFGSTSNDLYMLVRAGTDADANGVVDGLDDCNGNQIADFVELVNGTAQDTNLNRAIDSCEVTCPPDFNDSGTLTVQDIFDFLAAYFGNDPRADFNNSAAITVQDIFDFLAAYFAGCA